ncbi:phosphate ABC transporter, permease protein PstA, partial [Streptomyces sp. SID10244]|nr:phosphate ABC transporter, permease protein PstA [Streptomyces sp. SID10244]
MTATIDSRPSEPVKKRPSGFQPVATRRKIVNQSTRILVSA